MGVLNIRWSLTSKIQISKNPSSWQNECRVNKNLTKESKIPCKPNYVQTVKDISDLLVVKGYKQNIQIILNPTTLDHGWTKGNGIYDEDLSIKWWNPNIHESMILTRPVLRKIYEKSKNP